MPQDHFVAQTYLTAFADPQTKLRNGDGLLHAYAKRNLKYFTPSRLVVCKTLNWDQNLKYLSPPDALGLWLKTFEPHWAGAVERLSKTRHLSVEDKFVLAGYWAHLSTCTPTLQRVGTELQQAELDEKYLERFIEHATAHPNQYPRAKEYLPLVKAGTLKAIIDPDYPKGIATTQLHIHQWLLYHQEWAIVWNDTNELFITSDNPSCFDYKYGNEFHPARYLPLAPQLALWANIDPDGIPEMKKGLTTLSAPARRSRGYRATPEFVRDMNVLVIQSAENIVLASEKKAYVRAHVQKYRNWWVRVFDPIRIPTADGYYEIKQMRAGPKSR
jgi:Protein of unknown function (DUF4238)